MYFSICGRICSCKRSNERFSIKSRGVCFFFFENSLKRF
ncbi:MAG TPA: hypothetical protein DDX98_15820 [Bacteroidales bacterium]|nr:hypothetical protein [Bacteroidales bacterium]